MKHIEMYTYYKFTVIIGQTGVMLIHGHVYLLTSTNTIRSVPLKAAVPSICNKAERGVSDSPMTMHSILKLF